MRKRFLALLTGALVLALTAGAAISGAASSSANGRGNADAKAGQEHNLDGPKSAEQRLLKKKALAMKLAGKAPANAKVVRVPGGQYVELAREDTDKIFVMLVEFGDAQYPNPLFQGPPPDGSATDVTGPLRNEIPQPDRSVDNTTLWQADYNKAHYQDMYFNRMAKYYEEQSSGRYSVTGEVNGWVKVPFNEALYGRNYCGGIVCATTKALVRDSMAVWVKQQLDSGQTPAQVAAYLRQFDEWDRYDLDGDGNFDEPDGYIDHFQIVHAGGDEAAGDPHQGTDAIWSHRWYANLQAGGPGGLAGVNIGTNGGIVSSALVPNNPTGVWVGDYTIQPENGGLGVFAHEFGHDLGLPDLYDTSGNTGGAENSTAFWTLMSSGANIGDGGPAGIGDAPTNMGAWEKLQLGWLNYEVAKPGKKSSIKLSPSQPNTKQAQAAIVILPDKKVPLELGGPCAGCGSRYFYSGSGDELDVSMTKAIPALAAATPLAAQVRYQIEKDWDYAYLEVSSNGTTFTPIQTNLSTTTNPNTQNFGNGITGTTAGSWVALTATLPAGTTHVRFRYWTDVAATEPGFQVDQIAVGGQTIGTAENDTEGWLLAGFRTTTGSELQAFRNYYIAENRLYFGNDTSLKTAYNFGFLNTRPDWVESYRYQDGLLVTYWDTSQNDNNVGEHPGSGLVLPVDANPTFYHSYDGHLLRPRILAFDSTFNNEPREAITVNKDSNPVTIPAAPAQPLFDDTTDYWFNCDADACTGGHVGRYQPGWNGVRVPKTGTKIRVVNSNANGFMQIQVDAP